MRSTLRSFLAATMAVGLCAWTASAADEGALRKQIAEKQHQITEQQSQIREMERTLETVADQMATEKRQESQNAARMKELHDRWTRTLHRIETMMAVIQDLRRERDEIRTKLGEAIQQAAAARAELERLKEQEPHEIGAQGGSGGTSAIRTLTIPAGSHIVRVEAYTDRDQLMSFRFAFKTPDGATHFTEWTGGYCGHRLPAEILDLGEDERLVGVVGHGEKWWDYIDFVTTKRTVRMGGDGDDEDNAGAHDWRVGDPGYEIVGFIGRAGKYVDSLGLIVRKSDVDWVWN